MKQEQRIGLFKLAGWCFVIVSVCLIAAEFAESESWFHASVKEGAILFVLGVFCLVQADHTKRIVELERENAALRASRQEPLANKSRG